MDFPQPQVVALPIADRKDFKVTAEAFVPGPTMIYIKESTGKPVSLCLRVDEARRLAAALLYLADS